MAGNQQPSALGDLDWAAICDNYIARFPGTPTRWAALVMSYAELRGYSLRALARELGKSVGILSKWNTGTRPEHRSVLDFARIAGVPERLALEAAELDASSAHETANAPDYLTELLGKLTPAEMAELAATAQGFLRLREERAGYEAGPPRRGRPRKAPQQSPPE